MQPTQAFPHPIIDVHTHVFPDFLAARALKKLVEKSGDRIHPVLDGTRAGLLAALAKSGVDRAVVCPIATKPTQFEGILKESLAIRDGAYGPEARQRIIPLASVHPADPDRYAHLKEIADKGIRGVKVHPYYQGTVLDSPTMLEYFHCCRDLGLVVQCHCGWDIGFPRDPYCGPECVVHVVKEVPGLKFIAAHLGSMDNWKACLDSGLPGMDVWLDTSVIGSNIRDPYANKILREHPAERLLFATDSPWMSAEDGLTFIRSAAFPAGQEAAILGGNAVKLFRLAD